MRIALTLLMLSLLIGCGGGPRLVHVSGKVSFQGNPVPAGVVWFDPDVTKKNDGPQGYAFIKNGEYNTAGTGGKGVVAGPHVVRIEGYDGKPRPEMPMGRPLFPDFQQALDLPKQESVQNFDVPAKK